MLKIGLFGFGQMGKLLQQLAPKNQCKIIAIQDPIQQLYASESEFQDCDVWIDFTQPDAVLDNLKLAIQYKKNLVIGTTGWQHHLPIIQTLLKDEDIGVVFGSNFSLGMNLFYHLIQAAGKIVSRCPEYDVFGYEMHHSRKKDSPSGTAKKIATTLLELFPQKTEVNYDRINRQIEPHELHFGSIRAGSIPGTHLVGFDSEADTIEIKHTARNRSGFAIGALQAAHWIYQKKGIYQFEKIFFQMLEK